MPRTSPSELTISVTTSPQPPRRFTSRRKAVSVMPAIGASANGGARSIAPIFMSLDARDRSRRESGPASNRAQATWPRRRSRQISCSYAFFSSSFFHSMIAWPRTRARNLRIS